MQYKDDSQLVDVVYIPVNIEEAVKMECRRRRYSERTI